MCIVYTVDHNKNERTNPCLPTWISLFQLYHSERKLGMKTWTVNEVKCFRIDVGLIGTEENKNLQRRNKVVVSNHTTFQWIHLFGAHIKLTFGQCICKTYRSGSGIKNTTKSKIIISYLEISYLRSPICLSSFFHSFEYLKDTRNKNQSNELLWLLLSFEAKKIQVFSRKKTSIINYVLTIHRLLWLMPVNFSSKFQILKYMIWDG